MRKAFGPTSTLHFTRSLHVTPGHNFLLDLRRTVLLVLNSGVLFMFPHHFLTVFDRSHVLRYQAFIGEEFQESFSLTWDVHDLRGQLDGIRGPSTLTMEVVALRRCTAGLVRTSCAVRHIRRQPV